MKYTTIDLFSGCGGLTHGFKEAGFESLFAVEFTKNAADTFKMNHHSRLINKDVRDVKFAEVKKFVGSKKVNVVCGGPPCEGFSMAGKRLVGDPRNGLFLYLLKYAKKFKAELVLMENVPALLSMKYDKGKMIDFILASFKKSGYKCDYVILNAADFGVPQLRRRLFIIGSKDDKYKKVIEALKALQPQKTVTVMDALSDLPSLRPGEQKTEYAAKARNQYQEQMRNGNPLLSSHKCIRHSDKMVRRYSYIKQGKGMGEAWDRIPTEIRPRKMYDARGRRLDPGKPSYTLTSHCLDEFIHPNENRALSPREAARLQSFPDSYQFAGPYVTFHGAHELDQYEQVGDAVPPLLARVIAKEIRKVI